MILRLMFSIFLSINKPLIFDRTLLPFAHAYIHKKPVVDILGVILSKEFMRIIFHTILQTYDQSC